MAFSLQGQAVTHGIAIGRAVLAASRHLKVAQWFIAPQQIHAEIERLRQARRAAIHELQRLLVELPNNAPHELAALLEVHLLLLQDDALIESATHCIGAHLYNAEWAVTTEMERIGRQFDQMADDYLRGRKADMEQVMERILRHMKSAGSSPTDTARPNRKQRGVPLILVARDLSPADMLSFKHGAFTGFVTEVGSTTSHTAIVARSMDIPAVVGTRHASLRIRHDDWLIIDADIGQVIVNPPFNVLRYHHARLQRLARKRKRLSGLRHTPAITRDGQAIALHANIEQPSDAAVAWNLGAEGVGLFRSEFLFMGRTDQLPDEEEQYCAYRAAVAGMCGLPVTIRTLDVGADKPLSPQQCRDSATANPALGLRAIRKSLAEPAVFRSQLRAILRAAQHGPVQLMFPMLAQVGEIQQTLKQLHLARAELDARNTAWGQVAIGAMIEIPAAALIAREFLRHFDFLSIGTNDLIQYTLAIDRTDEAVAHLYDPLHPAVLQLISHVIAEGARCGKSVSICGEMAGDAQLTPLLLGLGLRHFSMQAAQLLAVKEQILKADTRALATWAQQVLESGHLTALAAQKNPPYEISQKEGRKIALMECE